MDTTLLPTINQQLVYLDRHYGSDALAADFVLSLISTIEDYTGDDSPEALQLGLVEIYNLLLACRPRMANLIFDLQELLIHTIDEPELSRDTVRSRLLELLALKRTRRQESVQHALTLLEETKTLLLHSYSSTLNVLFSELSKKEWTPDIILAAQDEKKTERMIHLLQKHNFNYRVVTEFAISHVMDEIDLALFGGLTLTSDMQVVMGPGSASLVSQLDAHEVASYVMLTTNKFSFWEETTLSAFREDREKCLGDFSYVKQVYSHDTLPMSLLEGIITERGILTPHQAQSSFRHLQQEFFEHEERVRALQ